MVDPPLFKIIVFYSFLNCTLLQPENILCIRKNSNKIKIIDFGLAQKLSPGLQVSCGTPEFLAPEVVSYDEVSKTTDMWSVGVICYVL